MWKKLIFVLMIFTIFQSIRAENNSLQNIKTKLDDIYYSFDANAYRDLINDISSYTPKDNEKFYLKYYNSIAMLNLGKITYPSNHTKAKSLFQSAEKECSSAIELSKKSNLSKSSLAELYAIYCDILSKKASLETILALSTGRRAHNAIEKGAVYDKSNAKLRLIAAIQLMHLPIIFGGDKAKSRELLNSVLLLQKHKSEDPLFISNADSAEVYAYLAQLNILENNIPTAESYIKKALVLEPNYGYVKIDLREQINKIKD